MNKELEKLSVKLKSKIFKTKIPTFEKPILATLTTDYFSNKNWIYERKLDGVRCLIIKDKEKVIVKSRNNLVLNDSYPEIVTAAKKLAVEQIILDGEIVTFANKNTSFEKLQPRIGVKNPSKELIKKIKIYVYVFDILYLDGYDITQLPLIKRKSILKQSVKFTGTLKYVTHKNTEGLQFLKEACKKGWEGLIAKKRDSVYIHERSKYWLKFKCIAEQELIVCGYTKPQNSRIGFGALLVGYYQDNKLIYAGKVGTGYSDKFLEEFSKKLEKIKISKNPFYDKRSIEDKDAQFVKPVFVAEIGFQEWTRDNKLRHPRFLGLRDDKSAKEVVKEVPNDIPVNIQN